MTLRHGTRPHHIGVGSRFAGHSVLLLVQDLDIRIVDENGEPIGALTLDPTTDPQRQSK